MKWWETSGAAVFFRGSNWWRTGVPKRPAARQGREIYRRCLENGLIFSQRREGSVLRFVPPATTTEGQMDQAMDILTEAMDKASVRGAVSG